MEHAFTLSSKSGEELTEGMPVYFSGFKIGRVVKLELSEQGFVLVKIRIPDQHVKWIKLSSVFSINKPLLGSTKLTVTTTNFNSPPLTSDHIPEIIRIDDINETIKRVQPTLEKVDKVVANIERITANLSDPHGDVNRILRNAEKVTANLSQKESIVEMVVGKPESVQAIHEIIKKAKDILTKTDDQVYGQDGALPLVRTILKDVVLKLEKLNKAVDNVITISSDAANSTKDLKLLRTEIDSTVNAIENLVNEIDKKIPSFKKETEIKLP
jgi:phospholipid/cholesterol/gamma-HCH transport system substrate-binding protein